MSMVSGKHVEALLKILDLERSRGYEDAAVVGGLDRYLQVYLGKARDSSESAPDSRICPAGFQIRRPDGGTAPAVGGEARRTLTGRASRIGSGSDPHLATPARPTPPPAPACLSTLPSPPSRG